MKKRTFEQIQASKLIYAKHATRYKAARYPEHRAKRMLAYTSVLTRAIAVSAQEASTIRSATSHDELKGQSREAVTNELQPPKFIRENCGTCDSRIYAREIMEYTGKVMEAPFIDDDGTKTMEYEYLYKCCKCGSKLWVHEQMAKESAIKVEASAQPTTAISEYTMLNLVTYSKLFLTNAIRDLEERGEFCDDYKRHLADIESEWQKYLTSLEVTE